MRRHYTAYERLWMETETLLASDPVIWDTYETVLEGES